MYQFIVTLVGEQELNEKDVLCLLSENILDATTCIRSVDGTVIINSEAQVKLSRKTNNIIEPLEFVM